MSTTTTTLPPPDRNEAAEEEFRDLAWRVISDYFKDGRSLIKHQLDSYNDFILRKLEQITEGFNSIELHHQYLPALERYKYVLNIHVHGPSLSKPMICEKDGSTKLMTPNDARLRNLTYSAPLNVDITVTARTLDEDTGQYVNETRQISGVALGRVPIMVRSRYCVLSQRNAPTLSEECRSDHGGYFIVNGNEKVIISQDRIAENKTYVFLNNKSSGYSLVAEVRSVPEARFGVPKTTALKLSSKPTQFGHLIRVAVHHIKTDVPLFMLFRAIGIESDRDIVRYIVPESIHEGLRALLTKELAGSMDDASCVTCQRDAYEYLVRYLQGGGGYSPTSSNVIASTTGISTHRLALLRTVLQKELLPHVGHDMIQKARYLGYMVNKLLRCHLGLLPLDDRDSYINKRIDTPGVLLASLFRQYYGKVVKDLKSMLQKDLATGAWRTTNRLVNIVGKNNVYKLVKATLIESGLKYGLATGNWGMKTTRMRQGVAQVLNRMTFMATVSHLRRVNTPIEKTGKLVQPRKLHSTQWGVICPCETPEGASIGLVKNLAMMSTITIASSLTRLRGELTGMGVVDESEASDGSSMASVFVNGDFVGMHPSPTTFTNAVRELKRNGIISPFTSVAWVVMRNEVHISSEGGRCVRPLVIVDDGNVPRLSPHSISSLPRLFSSMSIRGEGRIFDWTHLVTGPRAVLEYLDVDEANCSMIAMRWSDLKAPGAPRYTHLELDPCLMLGAVAGCIPFSDHNQAPRNTYQSAMGKQAIGLYCTNFRHRYDTMAHVLNYPQKPLVWTRTGRIMGCDSAPCGVNAIVAIATYTGFNQEDSVIMNQSAVDRGMFVSTFYRTYREQNNKNHSTGEEEFFCRPDHAALARGVKPYNYDKLATDGFVPENRYVEAGDVIVGKCMPQKVGPTINCKDTSVVLRSNERGFVDKNCHSNNHFVNVNGEGYTFCKVRLRSERIPTIGDKFSSRHGQKGTMGMLYRQEDMPFTESGLVPDIIINPHAIPSRMTIGQLMECIMGKACCGLGTRGDATPFGNVTVHDLAEQLMACGMESYGDEVMYNSRTGEQIRTAIFIGPTYYQRLKHMVTDKLHSRSNSGPVVLLTRQPAEGRARDGGLRLGEMEIECNWAHGIMYFLKERFMECSDNYRVFVCRKCGMIATVNPDRGIHHCHACRNSTHFTEVRVPYACKLLFQEVQTMGVGARFLT